MNKSISVLLLFLLTLVTNSHAQNFINGTVLDEKNIPVFGANIYLKSLKIGTTTNFKGEFQIKLPIAITNAEIEVSYIGYKKKLVQVFLPLTNKLVFILESDLVKLSDIVVSETRESGYLKNTAVKIEVIPRREIERMYAADLTEVCEFTPGLKVQNNCGVCGTTDIRIQGLEGKYTQMLINGFPIVSSLGTVYGLMGINASNIKQIEIVKGPGTILYGPEALAGTINVILKSPSNLPALMLSGSITNNSKALYSMSGTARWDNIATSLTVDYSQNSTRIDNNKDGFTDTPIFNRLSLLNQWMGNFKDHSVFLFGRYYYEDRAGGQTNWDRKLHRGTNLVYGESIYTNRLEILGGVTKDISEGFRGTLNVSYTNHDQDSYYGENYYKAMQQIFYSDVVLNNSVSDNLNFSAGTSIRLENYDDNSPATSDPLDLQINKPSKSTITSLFIQTDYKPIEQLSFLIGLRYNYHNINKSVFQPRFSSKYDISEHTSLRLSAGTGFRNVNLFTEDHSALTGSREVVITEDLKPEKSYNITSTLVHDIEFTNQFARFEFSAHFTRFSNKIIPDYETDPNKIIYANLSGYSVSQGLSLTGEYQFAFPMRLKLSYDFLDTYKFENNVKSELEFNAKHTANILLDYSFKSIGVDVNITGKIVGKQKMPSIPAPFKRMEYSPVYSLWDMKLTYSYGKLKVFSGVNNVFNFTQESPLVNPSNPFSDSFDTIYVYGPILGREIVVGFDYEI